MNLTGWVIAAAALLVAAGIVILNTYKTNKTMDKIEEILDLAMSGAFSEDVFDETRLSRLESKIVHYLEASQLSSRNIEIEKNKIKELISDISHQTKTPIANLVLYTELLLEEDLSEEAKANAVAVRDQAEKLRFLIDSLVKLSRLENGILAVETRVNPVEGLLYGLEQLYQRPAREKGLSFTVDYCKEAAVFDMKWTTEAIGNIIDNALKYTETGGVTVSATPYDLFVRVDITDTGIGIPEEEIPRVFARFYRSEQVRAKEGVGIGLFLAREIISLQGGYIKVCSKEGEGTTFSVFLPK